MKKTVMFWIKAHKLPSVMADPAVIDLVDIVFTRDHSLPSNAMKNRLGRVIPPVLSSYQSEVCKIIEDLWIFQIKQNEIERSCGIEIVDMAITSICCSVKKSRSIKCCPGGLFWDFKNQPDVKHIRKPDFQVRQNQIL